MARHFFIMMGLLISASVCGVFAEETNNLQPASKPLLERDMDLTSNRLKTRVIKVTLPQGYRSPLHTHEGPGPRYVVKGRVKIEESGQSHVYGEGDAFWETGQWMVAENVGEGDAVLVSIEMVSIK